MEKFTKKGVTYLKSTGEVVECLFCKIQNRQEPGAIVYEDCDYVVFKNIYPVTHTHLLVTPRRHIRSIIDVQKEKNVQLLKDLHRVGKIALGDLADGAQYSFHVPPMTSIDHLHLHAIAEPASMRYMNRVKYWPGTFYCRSVESFIEELEAPQKTDDTKDSE